MVLGAAFLLCGGLMVSEATSKKEPVWKLLTVTLIGGSVFIWFLVRSLVLQLYL